MRQPSGRVLKSRGSDLARGLLGLGALSGLASLVLTVGFPPSAALHQLGRRAETVALAIFVAEHLLTLARAAHWRAALRRRWIGSLLLVLLAVEGILLAVKDGGLPLHTATLARVYLVSLQVYLLWGLVRAGLRLNRRIARLRLRPAAVAFLVFAILILGGGALLMLPQMTPPGRTLHPIDALFTASSACCVTGLTVVETGQDFTRLGQGLLLVLIQLGGLGIMVLAAFLALVSGEGISIRERGLLQEVLNIGLVRRISSLVTFIAAATIGCELAGAGVLYGALAGQGLTPGERLFESLFHAVSAFCNAGFATHADSLLGFRRQPAVLLPILVLVILGGLGFLVLLDLWRLRPGGRARGARPALSIHSRLVLRLTAGLLLVGWGSFLALEWNRSLAGLPLGDRLLGGLFMAVTPRTAGFTVTDPTAWAPATVLVLILLMGIGGGSGSTAGGVKVSTLGVMLASVRSMIRGREQTLVGNRALPATSVREATVVGTLYLTTLCLGTLALMWVEGQSLAEVLFEVSSALGTVGLTQGVTAQASVPGKLILVFLMIAGRLGPLTLALAVAGPRRTARVRYPEGRIMVG